MRMPGTVRPSLSVRDHGLGGHQPLGNLTRRRPSTGAHIRFRAPTAGSNPSTRRKGVVVPAAHPPLRKRGRRASVPLGSGEGAAGPELRPRLPDFLPVCPRTPLVQCAYVLLCAEKAFSSVLL